MKDMRLGRRISKPKKLLLILFTFIINEPIGMQLYSPTPPAMGEKIDIHLAREEKLQK
jgi:hypothetical protein